MIIGIDESGNFDEKSNQRHLFVAAFIETENGKLEKKKQQFLNWESGLPDIVKNAKGEIKGNNLNQRQLGLFLTNVIFQEPIIRNSFVSIIPSKNPIHIIEKHQQFEIKQAEYNFEVYSTKGSKKRNINFLDNYIRWLKKRSISDYLKMLCLKNALKDTFHHTIIHSILNDRIEEALNFSYKIDKDFLTEENIYWEHYSRTSIQNHTRRNPLPILDTWQDDHPFIEKYIYQEAGRKVLNLNLVYENLKFLNSEDHIEIRIADIIGIILNRFHNRNELVPEYNLVSLAGPVKDAHLELLFNDFNVDETFDKYKKQAETNII